MRRFPITMAGFAALGVSIAAGGEPARTSFANLIDNSPFGQKPVEVIVAPTVTTLELRGVFLDHGEPFFSVFDTATHLARWVGLNEPGNPFVVRSYDLSKGQAVLGYQGADIVLVLKQAKVVALAAPVAPSSGPAPSAAPVAVPTAGPNSGSTPVVGPPASADEAKRLTAIAEEVRARRALRQQAAQAK